MSYKKPSPEELKKKLSPEQFCVTQENATEQPFHNPYWDNKKPGIYVDVVTGEPLFSSIHKFDSGTGWPSFTHPLEEKNITEKKDKTHGMVRIEVRSKEGDSHLGHLFDDGPAENGLRYCINSASLRFIAVDDLEKEGYGKFLSLFKSTDKTEVAVLAGGCFWGVEEILRPIPGVVDVQVGYTGGTISNPTYEMICEGTTGHAEAVQVKFDPKKISYADLLAYFFRLHDPTTKNQQHNDIGTQYRSAIFFTNEKQKEIAQRVIEQVDVSKKWKKPLVTEIVPLDVFYEAEEYHQDYLQKNPNGYNCHFLRD